MTEWQPGTCPITRDQTFGAKHYHNHLCGASPDQIAEDEVYLAHRKIVRQRWIGRTAMTALGAIICAMFALSIAFLVVLGSPWLFLSMISGGLIGWGVVWIGGKIRGLSKRP